MKIVRLEAENVKRLKAVAIRPDGAMVVVKGNNGQGKTSVLDAITYALGGSSLQPPKVIRAGEEHARVVLELDDIIVERTWTAKGTYLKVSTREGAMYPSPQAMLDKLVGTLAFDPLAFLRYEPKKQLEVLRRLAGIDFGPLDAKRKGLYEERTAANRRRTDAEAKVRTASPGEAGEEINVADLVKQLRTAQDQRQLNDKRRADLDVVKRELKQRQDRVGILAAVVQDLERRLEEARDNVRKEQDAVAAVEVRIAKGTEFVSALVDPDTTAIEEQLARAESVNASRRAARAYAGLVEDLKSATEKVTELEQGIAAVDTAKAEQLAAAKFPITGLSFTDDGVTMNDLPLEQASAAEQLRVSVAIGLALNPKLRVLLVRDGSLLDKKSLTVLGAMAEEAGAQVWLERVGTGDEIGILIEDGQASGPGVEVVEAPPAEAVEASNG